MLIALIFWGIGFLYNWKYKEAGLLGDLMVSASTAVTFILGGMIVGQPWNKIVWTVCLSLPSFFYSFAKVNFKYLT
jgi:geranylgeranylglycerol-phosphate geranylgeranyltransferase